MIVINITDEELQQIHSNMEIMWESEAREREQRAKDLAAGTLRKTLQVGDIVAMHMSYNGETSMWDFYKVLSISNTMATLVQLKKQYKMHGEPPYYYDTPEWVLPEEPHTEVMRDKYDSETDSWLKVPDVIKRKLHTDRLTGEQYIKITDYSNAKLWSGRPLANYNWH